MPRGHPQEPQDRAQGPHLHRGMPGVLARLGGFQFLGQQRGHCQRAQDADTRNSGSLPGQATMQACSGDVLLSILCSILHTVPSVYVSIPLAGVVG